MMSIKHILKSENKHLLCILLMMPIATLLPGQKAIISLDHRFSAIFPKLKYEGVIIDESAHAQFANNLSISVTAKILKQFYLKSELGTFDFSYKSRTSYRNEGVSYVSNTDYQSIQQHYFGFYPSLFFDLKLIAVSFGLGPDFYLIRTTVSDNSLEDDGTATSLYTTHPDIFPARIGFQGFVDVHFKLFDLKNFAITVGSSYRYNHLFNESNNFPGQLLNIYEFNIGVSYFIK